MSSKPWQFEIDADTRSRAVNAAQGICPFDLLMRGGQIVDVITGELRFADVGITGSIISSVHEPGARTDSKTVHDLTGKFLSPGFIDAHVHFESSHMLPHHYAATVVPQGTTTVFYDPHELANVLGVNGVRYAIEASRNLPLRFLCQAPSSVPSAPGLEVSGAYFDRAEMREMMSWPEVLGVAEMMDMNGVLRQSTRMVAIAEEGRAARKLIEGHARGLTGPRLQAYAAAGIGSDHEVTSGEDLLEKLRSGFAIEVRGSHDYVIPSVTKVLAELPHLSSQIMFCTDDVPPDVLVERGGMVDVIRRFIANGLKPTDAIRFATFNAALHLGRRDLGVICAGRIADILVLSDLNALTVEDVYVSGSHVANGKMMKQLSAPTISHPEDTMKIGLTQIGDFRLKVGTAARNVRVRTILGVRFSEWSEREVEARNGFAVLPDDLNLIYVQHRHGKHNDGSHTALQEGLPKLRGALATTYVHDSHNLFVIGGNSEDMKVAADALIASGGGTAVAQDGKLLAIIRYPIAGLLSEDPPEEVARQFQAVREAAGKVAEWKPPYWIFKSLEGMSLACNPFPYLTDVGLIDGKLGEPVATSLT